MPDLVPPSSGEALQAQEKHGAQKYSLSTLSDPKIYYKSMKRFIFFTVTLILSVASLLFVLPLDFYRSPDSFVRRLSDASANVDTSGMQGFLTTYTSRVTAFNNGVYSFLRVY